jgi:WhiB family transcriptional regulator, redox-sensing transcriptional regulator
MTDWRHRAACRGLDTNLFFPTPHETPHPQALAACQRCPVSEECLTYSLRLPNEQVDYGYWAGMDRDERTKEKRNRKRRLEAVA